MNNKDFIACEFSLSGAEIRVLGLPAFSDNYIWLIHNGHSAAVVDPGDASPVLRALDAYELELSAILITHHHFDHTGGIDQLLAKFPDGEVYGPAGNSVGQITQAKRAGDRTTLFGSLDFEVLEVPGHTTDHIAFYTTPRLEDSGQSPILFCGDTLFAGGCGRIFEGTAAQMYKSLNTLANLDPDTLIFCAHEYTSANLNFARAVEPDNDRLKKRIAWTQDQRARELPTVPSRLINELETNPFLRCSERSVKEAALRKDSEAGNPEAVFATIRRWKDTF